jgi:hypothetical protein
VAYDLKTRGVQDFRRFGDRLQAAVRDPLEGAIGTSNTVFRARFYPISSDPTPIVYTSGSLPATLYTLDRDSGVVIFDSPPTAQPTMTYKWSRLTDTEVVNILADAVDEMEGRWPRRWHLADSDGSTVIYPEDATEANIVNSDGNDPTCGADTFSTSTAEHNFLMACARYRYLANRLEDAAGSDFMFREDRGITVDKRSVPQNLALALDQADNRATRAMRAAMAKYYTGGEHLGAAFRQPGTKDYFTDHEWQTDSRDEDYRTIYAGTG